MRTLIKGYTFTAGTRSIDCSNCNPFDIENVRLIVNETKKVVICSSMQKDLIVSIVDGVITYAETLPVLADGDKLTIELDLGVSGAEALEAEVFEGKTNIAKSISDKGIPATSADTFSILANKITQIESNPPDPQVIAALDALNGEIITGTSIDKIDAAINSKSAIAVELENTGIEMDGKPLSAYAPMLRWALGTLGVYILGSDNAEYTAAEWRIIKNNPTPPTAIGVILRSTSQSFIISINEISKTFDVYNALIPNLTSFTSNQNLYKDLDGYTNSLRIMQFANPAMLTEEQGVYKYANLASFPPVGLPGIIYIDLSTNQAYWWVEGQYVNQGVKPYVDQNSGVGSQATEYAWNYKAYVGDTRQWYLPSIGQLMLIYANNIAINDCLNAINNLQLSTSIWWSSTQSPATAMWSVLGSGGNVSPYTRNYYCVVRAVSAY